MYFAEYAEINQQLAAALLHPSPFQDTEPKEVAEQLIDYQQREDWFGPVSIQILDATPESNQKSRSQGMRQQQSIGKDNTVAAQTGNPSENVLGNQNAANGRQLDKQPPLKQTAVTLPHNYIQVIDKTLAIGCLLRRIIEQPQQQYDAVSPKMGDDSTIDLKKPPTSQLESQNQQHLQVQNLHQKHTNDPSSPQHIFMKAQAVKNAGHHHHQQHMMQIPSAGQNDTLAIIEGGVVSSTSGAATSNILNQNSQQQNHIQNSFLNPKRLNAPRLANGMGSAVGGRTVASGVAGGTTQDCTFVQNNEEEIAGYEQTPKLIYNADRNNQQIVASPFTIKDAYASEIQPSQTQLEQTYQQQNNVSVCAATKVNFQPANPSGNGAGCGGGGAFLEVPMSRGGGAAVIKQSNNNKQGAIATVAGASMGVGQHHQIQQQFLLSNVGDKLMLSDMCQGDDSVVYGGGASTSGINNEQQQNAHHLGNHNNSKKIQQFNLAVASGVNHHGGETQASSFIYSGVVGGGQITDQLLPSQHAHSLAYPNVMQTEGCCIQTPSAAAIQETPQYQICAIKWLNVNLWEASYLDHSKSSQNQPQDKQQQQQILSSSSRGHTNINNKSATPLSQIEDGEFINQEGGKQKLELNTEHKTQLQIFNTYVEGGKYTVQLKAFAHLKASFKGVIQIVFSNENDYLDFKALLSQVCLIAAPDLNSDYTFMEKIGVGSQARVDLYREKKKPTLQMMTGSIVANRFSNNNIHQHTNQQTKNLSAFHRNNSKKKTGQNQCSPSRRVEDHKDSAAAADISLSINADSEEQQFFGHSQLAQNASIKSNHKQSFNEEYAVKTYTIGGKSDSITVLDLIVSEITFLRELKQCENIVHLKEVYTSYDSHTKSLNISLVMKYARHGSILRQLHKHGKFNEDQSRTIMMQLILAIDLMHRKNMIHRDIKADNILIMEKTDWKVCISDLGLACRQDDEVERRIKCGTPGYVGPEVLQGQPFTAKADIFSLGCLMFNLVTCGSLFIGSNNREILAANKYINPHQIVQMKGGDASLECKSLMMWMLESCPEKRPSAEQCLSHPWFSKDREALQGSLFLNKNQNILSNLLNIPQQQPSDHESDFLSFLIAPNYFEHFGASGQTSLGSFSAFFSQNNTAFALRRPNTHMSNQPMESGGVGQGMHRNRSVFVGGPKWLVGSINQQQLNEPPNQRQQDRGVGRGGLRGDPFRNQNTLEQEDLGLREGGRGFGRSDNNPIPQNLQYSMNDAPLGKSKLPGQFYIDKRRTFAAPQVNFCYNRIISLGREFSKSRERTRQLSIQGHNSLVTGVNIQNIGIQAKNNHNTSVVGNLGGPGKQENGDNENSHKVESQMQNSGDNFAMRYQVHQRNHTNQQLILRQVSAPKPQEGSNPQYPHHVSCDVSPGAAAKRMLTANPEAQPYPYHNNNQVIFPRYHPSGTGGGDSSENYYRLSGKRLMVTRGGTNNNTNNEKRLPLKPTLTQSDKNSLNAAKNSSNQQYALKSKNSHQSSIPQAGAPGIAIEILPCKEEADDENREDSEDMNRDHKSININNEERKSSSAKDVEEEVEDEQGSSKRESEEEKRGYQAREGRKNINHLVEPYEDDEDIPDEDLDEGVGTASGMLVYNEEFEEYPNPFQAVAGRPIMRHFGERMRGPRASRFYKSNGSFRSDGSNINNIRKSNNSGDSSESDRYINNRHPSEIEAVLLHRKLIDQVRIDTHLMSNLNATAKPGERTLYKFE